MITQGTKLSSLFDLSTISNGTNGTATKGKENQSFSDLLSNTTAISKETERNSYKVNSKNDKSYTALKNMENSTKTKDGLTNNKKVVKQSESIKNEASMSNLKDVAKVMEDVKEVLQESLGITEEELENAMEVLGLSMLDLFNPASLQQLLLTTTGNEDILSFVTNEELANSFSDLVDKLQSIATDSNIPIDVMEKVINSEEFNSFLNQNLQKDNSDLSQNMNELNTLQQDSESEIDVENISETSNEIKFSVERSDNKSSSNESSNEPSQESFKNSDVSQAENFLDHLASKVTTTETTFSGELSTVTTIREIANQIIEEIKVVIKPSQTSMEMQLNPENLGKVQLTITSKEGMMTAQFTTQTQMAKEAIESQLQILKQNLENQGVKVEAIEVNVSNFSFTGNSEAGNGQNSGTQKGKKAFRMDVIEDIEEFTEASQMQTSILDETISNIDYSA